MDIYRSWTIYYHNYVVYSLLRNAVLGILGFYNIEDIMKTIDLLLGTDVIDVGPRRRGGSNRLKNNLLCQDSYLLDALVKLDGNSSMPRSWSRCARHTFMQRSMPAQLNDISLAESTFIRARNTFYFVAIYRPKSAMRDHSLIDWL